MGLREGLAHGLQQRDEGPADIDHRPVRAVGALGVAILVQVKAVEAEALGCGGEVGDEMDQPIGRCGVENEQEIAQAIGLTVGAEQRLMLPYIPFLGADRIDRGIAQSA
ncbi:hypothetical protein D3C86_1960980 [compost metagenome]